MSLSPADCIALSNFELCSVVFTSQDHFVYTCHIYIQDCHLVSLLEALVQSGILCNVFVRESMDRSHEEDSDSAPEDVTFQDAKSDALAHLKTVSDAAKQKKKLRRDQIKKRQEVLAEQRQIKKQKLDELESKKLPTEVLNDLDETEDKEDDKNLKIPRVHDDVQSSGNSRIVFEEQEGSDVEEDNETDAFIALSTEKTDFKVVTSTDLRSSTFKSKDAYSFRERMLFGDRVKREPHKNQRKRQEKMAVTGLSQKLSATS